MMADDPLFHLNEGALPLDVPGVWEDKTIHVLRLPGHGHAVASLVITRETLPLGADVGGYTRTELGRMQATLPEFVHMGRLAIPWPDMTGEANMLRWRSSEGMMDQIVACRPVDTRRLLIFTATHPTPMPADTHRALLAAITGFRPRAPVTAAGMG